MGSYTRKGASPSPPLLAVPPAHSLTRTRLIIIITTTTQSQLRQTAQRLGQLRDRLDAQGQVASKDISTLLAQRGGAVPLARAKAQRLIQDEITADLLEHLEFLLAVLIERLADLDRCALLLVEWVSG